MQELPLRSSNERDFQLSITLATTNVNRRKMRRREERQKGPIGIEQFGKWKYVSTYGNAIKDWKGVEEGAEEKRRKTEPALKRKSL